MAATIKIYRWTGAGPSSTDVTGTNTRIDASDTNSTASTSNPVTIPASSVNYSYWGSYQLHCTVAPATNVNNLQIYSDGANSLGTGVALKIAQATTYAQAAGVPGHGTQLTTGNYATLTGAPVDFFSYSSGATLALTGSTSGTGDFGNFFVLQYSCDNTASPGPTAVQEVLTVQFDEY